MIRENFRWLCYNIFMVKRGLGKGFDELIPTDIVASEFDATAGEDEKVSDLRVLDIHEIAADPEQPRRSFDEESLQELADSIREFGILQPIVVTPAKSGFTIVAGERRWRAAKLAGLAKIPAIVRTLSAQHKLELSIIENVQRADLNPLETATAYVKLKNQFNLTDAEIAKRVGKNPTTVNNQLRLLKLPEFAKNALAKNEISEGHARQILALTDEKAQEKLFNEISRNNWSVRKAEQFVIGYKKSNRESGEVGEKSKVARSATMTETELTRDIAAKLGFAKNSVAQKTTAHGGEIVIKFANENEFNKIRKMFAKCSRNSN